MKPSYLFVLLIIILPILIYFLSRGAITHDEGYILHAADRLSQGQIPYRDFSFVYTPLSIFLTSFIFLFQTSVLSSRFLMLIIALISCFLIYRIMILSTHNKLYATIALVTFIAWGPTHINFAWPVSFAILTGLLTCFLLLKFLDTRYTKYLFIAGFCAFLVFLSKQNFGVAILFPILAFFLVKNARKIQYILTFIIGYCWGIIFFGIYLLYTDSFAPFIIDFYNYSIVRILITHHLTTSFIYKDALYPMVGRSLLYLLPLLTSLAAFSLLFYRRRFHLLFMSVFVAAFYIFGIRPTTDYVHLVSLLSLVGIPIGLYLRYNISSNIRILILISTLLFIILGSYTALFKEYYRWDYSLIHHNNFNQNPRILVYLNQTVNDTYNEIYKTVDQNTSKNDYIFVNSYNPMLYFITSRKDPMKNNFLLTEVNPDLYFDETERTLAGKEVKLLILMKDSINHYPIKNYIKNNYFKIKTINNFDIYIRKS